VVDAEFKAVAGEVMGGRGSGPDRGPYKLVVVENTPEVHNVILHAVSLSALAARIAPVV
jgi:hypothetical protein